MLEFCLYISDIGLKEKLKFVACIVINVFIILFCYLINYLFIENIHVSSVIV